MGRHLERAARALGLSGALCDMREAYRAPALVRAVNWRLRGRRPARLRAFCRDLLHVCEQVRPDCLLTTGLAPLDPAALRRLGERGVRRINYLTDDPWSPVHHAPWFIAALRHYDRVFSPRRANLDDLRRAGARGVAYLPFAYAPDVHFPDPPADEDERARFAADVVFVGGADRDRLEWVRPLIAAGFRVALYGGYWDRFPETRALWKGMADAETVRKAIGGAATALCLVRRANRDGHSMRSFEVPAIGACMLVEDTIEHREIFGDDLAAVAYVSSPQHAVRRLQTLLPLELERRRLREAAHRLIRTSSNTWQARLERMIAEAEP